jgi:crotonobetainyl-CoA:carnitine CoA-transferase CaiB-like acyl-CoA transferase
MTGDAARVDFSMIEAMLWTLAEPLLGTQSSNPPKPRGNQSDDHILHGSWRCAGDDAWISIAVSNDAQQQRLRDLLDHVPLEQWLRERSAQEAETLLLQAGVPAAALANSLDIVASKHLRDRGFWEDRLPGLPWRASFRRKHGAAPGLGADTDAVLRGILGLSGAEIHVLRRSGIFG